MSNTITCPKCNTRIEITEVMSAQLRDQIQADLEAQFQPEREALRKQAEDLKRQRAELDQSRQAIDEQVRTQLAKERDKLMADARAKAQEDLAVEIKDRDERLNEVQARLKEAQERELAWRKKERELRDREEELRREREEMADQLKRQVAEGRAKLIEEGKKKAAEEYDAQLREREQQLRDVQQKLKTAQDAEQAVLEREKELARLQASIERQRQSMDRQVQERLAQEREKLTEQARKAVHEELAVELKDRDTQVAELKGKLQKAAETELALRKQERELKEKTEQLQLEVARQLDAERDKIRDTARKQAAEEHQLKVAEKDKKIADLVKQLDDMKRKAEQGSQQAQGEIMEVALESLLRETFRDDSIEEVPKGVEGGDVLQRVRTPGGVDCGTILWESKRTKNWSDQWLPKLRTNQRDAKAAVAVLVSTAMPAGVDYFTQIDGVWVCNWSCAGAVATALRAGLLEAASARRALEGQHGKMEQVYNYLASMQFRNRVGAVVEAFKTMREDLESEKRAITKQWAKREKQIELAGAGMAGMYGDFQAIIGASLPEIEGMSMLQLEAPS